MKKNKVSVGIAAYNEEKNISKLLKSILQQNTDNWLLHEIVIACDGCTDNTIAEIKKIKNSKIKIISDKNRKGKVYRLNQIIKSFTGDILLTVDADISLMSNNNFKIIISKFLESSKIMLVGANSRPHSPKTFFEKAVNSTINVYLKKRESVNNGNNMLASTGACLALRKKFAKEIKLDTLINEDDYIYLKCIKLGYTFAYAKDALVLYKLPSNLYDYVRQFMRSNPTSVSVMYNEKFGDIIKKEYNHSFILYIRFIFEEFLKNPIGIIYISLIRLIIQPFIPTITKKYNLNWYTAKSTK
jgi:glycosyltransferase involved in cell wall biosynthesis